VVVWLTAAQARWYWEEIFGSLCEEQSAAAGDGWYFMHPLDSNIINGPFASEGEAVAHGEEYLQCK